MLNKPLFAMEWKSNYKLLIIFCLILTMYITMITTMYDPELGAILDKFAEYMPEVMSIAGMSGPTGTLVQFLSTYLYGFLLTAFPLIFMIILSLKLIVRKIDNGSMSFLMSSGVRRSSVWFTQLMVLLSFLTVLLLYCVLLMLICSAALYPGELEIASFLRLNMGLFCLLAALSSIGFLASCIFDEYKSAALLGAGIPVLFLLIQMLANMKGNLENFKYATIMTLFDSQELIAGSSEGVIMCTILALLAILCFSFSAILFRKRDLPL